MGTEMVQSPDNYGGGKPRLMMGGVEGAYKTCEEGASTRTCFRARDNGRMDGCTCRKQSGGGGVRL